MRIRKRALPNPKIKNSKAKKLALRDITKQQNQENRVKELEKKINQIFEPTERLKLIQQARAEFGRASKHYDRLERQTAQAATGRVLDHYRITNPSMRKNIHRAIQEIIRMENRDVIGKPEHPIEKTPIILQHQFDSKKSFEITKRILDEINVAAKQVMKEFREIKKHDWA